MDRVPPLPVKAPPNLVPAGSFSLERLLSHIDPGPAEESEAFVRLIDEQRHVDISSASTPFRQPLVSYLGRGSERECERDVK